MNMSVSEQAIAHQRSARAMHQDAEEWLDRALVYEREGNLSAAGGARSMAAESQKLAARISHVSRICAGCVWG